MRPISSPSSALRLLPLLFVALAPGCGEDTTGGDLGGTADLRSSLHTDLRPAGGDLAGTTDGPMSSMDLAMSMPVSDSGMSLGDMAMDTGDLSAAVGDMAGGCGNCPKGYSCGTANGIPVCRAPSGIPYFNHVFVIVMENVTWDSLDKSNNTPYIHGLKAKYAYSTNYHGVAHPSLPNYVAMVSGGTAGIGCDCEPTGGACNFINCTLVSGACGCGSQKAGNVADDIEAAGLTWRAYGESMGAACNIVTAGQYAARHVPFVYFSSIQGNQNRCNTHVIDYMNFAKDLGGATPNFNFIAPNLTDDMHDPILIGGATNYGNGDKWLTQEMPAIVNSAALADNGILFLVWDEDDNSGGLLGSDDPVGMFVVSPLANQNGFVSNVKADHYSLLATFEDGLGLPRLGKAAQATPLTDFFPAK